MSLCGYGNCSTEGTPIVVSSPGFRARFCSWQHAALACTRMLAVGGTQERAQVIKETLEELARRFGQKLDGLPVADERTSP